MKKTVALILAVILMMSAAFSVSTAALVDDAAETALSDDTVVTTGNGEEGNPEDLQPKTYPEITRITPTKVGLRLELSAFEGAAKYRVFQKADGSWKKLGDTTALMFDHLDLKNNTSYTYTVRAMDGNGQYCSEFFADGWSETFFSMPVIKKIESVYGGLKISWNAQDGVKKFKLYKKDGDWQSLVNTDATSYVDTEVEAGKTYTYTLRCLSDDESALISFYDKNGVSATYIPAPEITKIENQAKGVKLTISKVTGAAKYRVFLSKSGSWTKLGDTASTSFVHAPLKDEAVSAYTVRALSSSGSYISGFKSKGWKNRFFAPPTFTKITPAAAKTTLSWSAKANVAGARVYRKSYGGAWQTLVNTTETSFEDTTVPANTPVAYTFRYLDEGGAFISHYINSDVYYYNGALANGKITFGGKTMYFSSGKTAKRGYVTTGGKTYYYNDKGVLMKDGIVGTKAEGYCYADKTGAVNFKFTGVAKNASGYWYFIKGKLDFSYRGAVTSGGKNWNVIGGKANLVKTAKDKTLFRALKVVAKVTTKDMTNAQKLKKCFDYVKKAYGEYNPRIPHYRGMDWPILYANDMFVGGKGNCFSYASAFCFLAKAIGYTKVYACSSGGHGWAEINGKVYDPEWSRHSNKSTYFGISYETKTDVAYKAAISAGKPWMHVKV